jgi:hypothetical protein
MTQNLLKLILKLIGATVTPLDVRLAHKNHKI